ncbi:MAG: hypothetical protein V1809_16495 [Planctomycetota bacterium]
MKHTATRFQDFLSRHGVFYLLSAFLVLAGSYLIAIPCLFQYRELKGLLMLLGILNLYEAMVIMAFGYIVRREPSRREGSVLIGIELLFLLDATFTINACLPLDFWAGIGVLGGSLVLALIKMKAIEIGAGFPIFGGIRSFLVPALVLLYGFQPFLADASGGSEDFRTWEAGLVWTAFGALPLLLFRVRWKSGEERWRTAAGSPSSLPWWASAAFPKTVVVLTLLLVQCQLIGQSWVYEAPFQFHFFYPMVFSAMAVMPVLVRPGAVDVWAAGRILLTVIIAWVMMLGDRDDAVAVPGTALSFSPGSLTAAFAAVANFIIWRRERRGVHGDFAFLFLGLVWLGPSYRSVAGFFAYPDLIRTGGLLALAGLWLGLRWSHARVLLAVTAACYWGLCRWAGRHPDLDVFQSFVHVWPVMAFGISLMFRETRGVWRAALVAATLGMGLESVLLQRADAAIYFWMGAEVILVAGIMERRRYLAALPVYLIAGELFLTGIPRPHTPVQWGIVVLVTAFALFGVGFLLTRRRLKYPVGAGFKPAPTQEGKIMKEKRRWKRVMFWLGLAGFVIGVTVIYSIVSRGRINWNKDAAIGNLGTIRSAQGMFKEMRLKDVDGDGEGEFGSMSELAGAQPPLIDAALASGYKQGYRYRIELAGDPRTDENEWWACATPFRYGVTECLAMYVDESGIIRVNDIGGRRIRTREEGLSLPPVKWRDGVEGRW